MNPSLHLALAPTSFFLQKFMSDQHSSSLGLSWGQFGLKWTTAVDETTITFWTLLAEQAWRMFKVPCTAGAGTSDCMVYGKNIYKKSSMYKQLRTTQNSNKKLHLGINKSVKLWLWENIKSGLYTTLSLTLLLLLIGAPKKAYTLILKDVIGKQEKSWKFSTKIRKI